jgi:hypothetical protein
MRTASCFDPRNQARIALFNVDCSRTGAKALRVISGWSDGPGDGGNGPDMASEATKLEAEVW